MLIIDASLDGDRCSRIRIEGERIAVIDESLQPRAGETVLEAGGGVVLPGLHDHHLHLLAYAAALDSVPCGPPAVNDATLLGARLAAHPGTGWLRGVGYHETVAGELDRDWLDRVVPGRPVRIQHRSGQLWIFNTAALQALGVDEMADPADHPCERIDGRLSGRLYGGDDWLRARLGATMPDLAVVSSRLAQLGITGVTDASPANGAAEFRHFSAQRQAGRLRQEVLMMGSEELDPAWNEAGLMVGPTKIHLREIALPDFDHTCARMRRSHAAGRAVAVHCVTEAELVFALAAFEVAGVIAGDRIEHAALASPPAVAMLAAAGLRVVTQPNFIYERGDTYLQELDASELDGLYRARSFVNAGVPVAAGSDAPYGDPDPWRAIAAARERRSRTGQLLLATEVLEWDAALRLYTSAALDPGGPARRLQAGAMADLCILDCSWAEFRADPAPRRPLFTLGRGQLLYTAQAGASSIASTSPH